MKMTEMNLGEIVSLAHCKKCGCPNEITFNQEKFICTACGENNNLKFVLSS